MTEIPFLLHLCIDNYNILLYTGISRIKVYFKRKEVMK